MKVPGQLLPSAGLDVASKLHCDHRCWVMLAVPPAGLGCSNILVEVKIYLGAKGLSLHCLPSNHPVVPTVINRLSPNRVAGWFFQSFDIL
jgi:hypothetical protein